MPFATPSLWIWINLKGIAGKSFSTTFRPPLIISNWFNFALLQFFRDVLNAITRNLASYSPLHPSNEILRRMHTSISNTQSSEMQSITTTSISSIPGKTDLLSQLENILESDPLIDEVGFIHPSQFAALSGEVPSIPSLSSGGHPHAEGGVTKLHASEANASNTFFWNRERKLGISTLVILSLYTEAKDAFMDAHKQYSYLDAHKDQSETTSSPDIIESQLMKHSRALLLLSSDFGTAWNSRKLILSKKLNFRRFMDELHFSALVLSYSPKSERAWSHRRWVIKMIAGNCPNLLEIVERESELVKIIAEVKFWSRITI